MSIEKMTITEAKDRYARSGLAMVATLLFAMLFLTCGPAAASTAVDRVCPNRMPVTANGAAPTLPYCSNRRLVQADTTVRRAVIVVHGSSRNADEYYQYVENAARKAGALDDTIILAPQFLTEEDISSREDDDSDSDDEDGDDDDGDDNGGDSDDDGDDDSDSDDDGDDEDGDDDDGDDDNDGDSDDTDSDDGDGDDDGDNEDGDDNDGDSDDGDNDEGDNDDDGDNDGGEDDNVLYWSDDGWKQGDQSLSTSSDPRQARISSFGAVDVMMERLANRDVFPNLQEVVVTGHSAGGQFTNRFAAGSRAESRTLAPAGIEARYVIANPSSYLYLDAKRRVAGTTDQFAVPQTACSGYDTYKHGLQGLNEYMRAVGPDLIKSQYAQREVVYLLGERDSDPASSSLDNSCEGNIQGRHRLERGTIFYDYLQQFYGAANVSTHTKALVPGIEHDGEAMYNSDQGMKYLFDELSPPTPRPSVAQLVAPVVRWLRSLGAPL